MNFLLLGCGKTGSLVAEVGRERRHEVRVLRSADNQGCSALTAGLLKDINVVLDFTTPTAVVPNIKACIRAGKEIVVGTTGWYGELPSIRQLVEENGTGFLYGTNFSIGMNLFFETARAAAPALQHEYSGQIFERHHAHKKDAPSGSAVTLRKIVQDMSGKQLEIISFREGEVVGMHEMIFDSPNDRIYLCHDSKSRRGFAEGAIRAAEWLAGKKGFFDVRDIWKQL